MTGRAGATAAASGAARAVVAGGAAGGEAGIWGPKSTSYVATRGSLLLLLGGSAWGSDTGPGPEATGATVAGEGASAVLRMVPAAAAAGLDADGAEAALPGLAGAVLDGGGVPGADGAGAVMAGPAVGVVLAGIGAGDCSGEAGEVLVGASAGGAWPQWAAVRGWGTQYSRIRHAVQATQLPTAKFLGEQLSPVALTVAGLGAEPCPASTEMLLPAGA